MMKSDDVPRHLFLAAVQHCPNFNCEIEANYSGSTMLGGAESFYNRNGWKVIKDPNFYTVKMKCRICGDSWSVNEEGKIINAKQK